MTTHHDHPRDGADHDNTNHRADDGTGHERTHGYRPRIWLASLADYTAGILHGQWVDATQTPEQLDAARQHLLATSSVPDAEEYAIFDYDDFAGFHVGENELLEIVSTVARGVAEYGAPYAVYADIHGADPAMLAGFTDAYVGTYDSPEQWAEQLLDDEGIPRLIAEAVPEEFRTYVHMDYQAWARDAALSGAMHYAPLPDGRVAVFQIP